MQEVRTDLGYPIYGHGFWVRLKLAVPPAEARRRLRRIGWSGPKSGRWRPAGKDLYALRGSLGLTGRRPRRTSVLGKLNLEWHTRLYHVGIECHHDATYVDLKGVRWDDIERFFGNALGLGEDGYEVAYFRRLERFIVLAPPDAHRLAGALNGWEQRGRGPLAGISYLVRKHSIEIPVRTRAKRTIREKIYRVTAGATSAYKYEVWIEGKRRDKTTLTESEIRILDERIKAIVDAHHLCPIEKPALWEPIQPHRMTQDRLLRRFPRRVYQGSLSLTPDFHPPVRPDSGVRLVSQGSTASFRTHARLSGPTTKQSTSNEKRDEEKCKGPQSDPSMDDLAREFDDLLECAIQGRYVQTSLGPSSPSPDWGSGTPTRETPPQDDTTSPVMSSPAREHFEAYWMLHQATADYVAALARRPRRSPGKRHRGPPRWATAIATDLQSVHDGSLIEIVLDGDQDPTPVVEALRAAYRAQEVGVHYVGQPDDIWYGLRAIVGQSPPADPSVEVVVVDPDAIALFDLTRSQKRGSHATSMVPSVFAGFFWRVLAELRLDIERSGGKLVFITTDCRPGRARGDFFRKGVQPSARLRSSLGDAARYHANQRYFVEGRGGLARVVCWKDKAQGLMGRIVHEGIPAMPWWEAEAALGDADEPVLPVALAQAAAPWDEARTTAPERVS